LPEYTAGRQPQFGAKPAPKISVKNYMSGKIGSPLPATMGASVEGVNAARLALRCFEMNDHNDQAKAENCSNYAANDGEEYRNMMNFEHDEF
jgi:hypothetical protein